MSLEKIKNLKMQHVLGVLFVSIVLGQKISQPQKPINRNLNIDWKIFKHNVQISPDNSGQDLSWRRKFEESYELINRHNLEYELNPHKVNYKLKLTEYAHMVVSLYVS